MIHLMSDANQLRLSMLGLPERMEVGADQPLSSRDLEIYIQLEKLLNLHYLMRLALPGDPATALAFLDKADDCLGILTARLIKGG